jgi:homoserine dehydrogenase
MCIDVVDSERSEKVGVLTRKIRVAVAGLGTIGEGAALRLLEESDTYALCAALVRYASKPRAGISDGVTISDDLEAVFEANPDVVVDALPVGDSGRILTEQALSRGISVVSANKQALAGSLDRLAKLAERNDAALCYSAAVGGGSPMVETVRNARDAGEIVEMTAILNGTVNYILTALADGVSFDAAVKQAQDAGFAEPDPTADLSGDDARAKISILAYDAFGEEVDLASVTTEALTAKRAAQFVNEGGAWKQLSRVKKDENGRISASLAFEKVAKDDFFADVSAEGNALQVVVSSGEALSCRGKGAGRAPTVGSLFADLARIAPLFPLHTDE